MSAKITCEWYLSSPPQIGSLSPNRDVFLLVSAWFREYFPFIDEKIYSISEMKLLSKWPLTHHLYSQYSLALTLPLLPSFPLSTFTRPCECSIYCNCIQHLALQTADKPAQGQPPTLAMFINRLFVQAYQSPYPLSPCGCLWTLCSLHQNRSPV